MKNEEIMKSGSVWKAIASMAIPSAVIMIVMIFYNIADMYFIAKIGDAAQVAAVGKFGQTDNRLPVELGIAIAPTALGTL